jgi:hypothetical protein
MDVSELRKRILRALDDARKDATGRRAVVDESAKAFQTFLANTAVPLLKQAASVLNAANYAFVVHTPAESVRLVAEKSPDTYLEIELDVTRAQPVVMGRVSITRGRQGLIVEERELAEGAAVDKLTEEDVSAFLIAEVPKLVAKP